ncbi:hypothetical protein [Croceivirga sp. JEA036]|uniref:hypothetical protein n=1 Tax=Croceivirga sp. JEA036 TaxID=2721162 RepID=UPI0014399C58|nr:hypothetical protein [Croceivirga sp. JEA036]NJB36360.1 hypothetical protein [Croceivirga sp. JEA036]
MNKAQIIIRLDLLIAVQRYTKLNGTLSAGKRICISMERASLMHCLDQLAETPNVLVTPKYVLPKALDREVQQVYDYLTKKKPECP